jgi:hypothetical protein
LLTSVLLGTTQADEVSGGSCCVSDSFHVVVVLCELLLVRTSVIELKVKRIEQRLEEGSDQVQVSRVVQMTSELFIVYYVMAGVTIRGLIMWKPR